MKDYLFLFRGGGHEGTHSPEEMQRHLQKWYAWVDELKAKGVYLGGHPLTRDGKTLRGKSMLLTDGAYAEGKEIIGGYFHIRAASIEDAVMLAKDYPDFMLDGSVEVREVMMM